MALWADFSEPSPGAVALKNAGFTGVIRYIGLGSSGKRIHAAEYKDYVAHDMDVLLVAELGVSDAWAASDDYSIGKTRGQTARQDARNEGIPDNIGIACAADAHATSSSQISDAVEYARGFAEGIGDPALAGFYGFIETSQAVHNAGVVGWHWRCGSRPSLADQSWVHFWQNNNETRTVNAVVCDINETFASLHSPEDDVSAEEVWARPLTSSVGYTAPAVEWVLATSGRAEDIQGTVHTAIVPMLGQILSAVTGGGIDPQTLLEKISEDVKTATAEAITASILPVVQRLESALANDNATEAKEIVEELSRRLQGQTS